MPTLFAEEVAPSGMPLVETATWFLAPMSPWSLGLQPVSSPPRSAKTEQMTIKLSQAEYCDLSDLTVRDNVDAAQKSEGRVNAIIGWAHQDRPESASRSGL